MVQNTTLPLPGRWRTSTTPATQQPGAIGLNSRLGTAQHAFAANSARRKRIGCDFSDRPAVW